VIGRRRRNTWQRALLHGALVVLSALFLVPLIWLVGSSLKSDDQIRAFPPEWLPDLPYYAEGSPYIDAHERAKALRRAGGDFDAAAAASTLRMLAIGEVTLQGEARDGAEQATVLRELRWRKHAGEVRTGDPTTIDGQPGAKAFYGRPMSLAQIKELSLAIMMYQRQHGPTQANLPLPAPKGTHGSICADLAWTPDLARFANLTLRLHGDRSWRYVRVRLHTPDGAYCTPRPILLSFANWTDCVLLRQAKGSIPWGTYRLVSDPGGRASPANTATLELEILAANHLQVILRKLLHNYPAGLTFIPFGKYLTNTLLICALVVFGTLISCSLVAYGLARIRWRGRNALFYVILATMMLPFQVTMVPLFVVFARLGWVDTFLPLFVPAFFGNAFFIFLLRQFFLTVPTELSDAARIDGCSEWDIYWRVVLPLAKPALATVGLFAFMSTWNDYVGPLIYLSDASKYTLSLGLATFSSQYGSYPGMLMAVTTVMTIPIILLFFLAQRTFIQGITLTGIKG
jgi:multiple sugar transport system permease protein